MKAEPAPGLLSRVAAAPWCFSVFGKHQRPDVRFSLKWIDVKGPLMPRARDRRTRDGPSPPVLQNDLPLGTRAHATGRPPASIYQRRARPEHCLSFWQEANQINKRTNGERGRGEKKRGKTVGLVPPASSISPTDARGTRKCTFHTERWRMLACRKPTCHLSHHQRAHLLCRVSLPATSASVIPPPRLIISPSSIYGPLSALFSLHPHTHSSNRSS